MYSNRHGHKLPWANILLKSTKAKRPLKSQASSRDENGQKAFIYLLTSDETLGTVHGDGPNGVLSEVLSDLEDKSRLTSGDVQSVQDFREAILELDRRNFT